jgi:hypothetical protein
MNFLNYIFSYFFVIGRATPAGKEFMPPRKSSPRRHAKDFEIAELLGRFLVAEGFHAAMAI